MDCWTCERCWNGRKLVESWIWCHYKYTCVSVNFVKFPKIQWEMGKNAKGHKILNISWMIKGMNTKFNSTQASEFGHALKTSEIGWIVDELTGHDYVTYLKAQSYSFFLTMMNVKAGLTCCSVWLTPSRNTSSERNMAAAVLQWMLLMLDLSRRQHKANTVNNRPSIETHRQEYETNARVSRSPSNCCSGETQSEMWINVSRPAQKQA